MIATWQTHRHDDPVFVVFDISSITCFLAASQRRSFVSEDLP